MSSQFSFAKRALVVGALSFSPALCLAEGVTINFRGAIVEEPCSVFTSQLRYDAGDLRRGRARQVMASSPLELNLKCHAAQAVQISFEQDGQETRAGFGTGINGVTMTMSHNGRELPPGQVIGMAIAAGQQKQLHLDTHLRGNATSPEDKVRSAILVSLNYR